MTADKKIAGTILVVDDSQTARNYHRRVLESSGFTVTTAADGAAGLEQLLRGAFDLVVADVNMTGMNGLEFIRRLRQVPASQFLPVIIVSTERAIEDKRQGYTAGANLYLTKPCRPEILVESIKMLIQPPRGS